MSEESLDKLLHKVPATRRRVIKSLLIGAFVVPAMSVFPLDGRKAMAAGESISNLSD